MVGVGYSISGVKEREDHSEPLSWNCNMTGITRHNPADQTVLTVVIRF